ncbi:phage tail protein [Escherichia coli]
MMPFARYFCIFINVRLGAGAPAIGIPFFWPSSAMPNTVMTEWADMVFLKFNGATFSATTYPKLALVIPSLTLVDARGEFPRIWDDGRGIDAGRALLSAQGDAIRNITGGVSGRNATSTANIFGVTDVNGAFGASGAGVNSTAAAAAVSTGAADRASSLTFDASKAPGVVTASENRPRNIAFNFLVRAK